MAACTVDAVETLVRDLDAKDPLRLFRQKFELPKWKSVSEALCSEEIENVIDQQTNEMVYMSSNSLGLPPKICRNDMMNMIDQWSELGVLSHTLGKCPTENSDHEPRRLLADFIVGALFDEVSIMESLSANIHSLLLTFYRPTDTKKCILIEKGAFPSDFYSIESQIALNGYNPSDCIIEIELVQQNNSYLATEEIVKVIQMNADRLALIFLGGVQFYTGQLLDMKAITEAGHRLAKCPVGWDLAHAVGNVPLNLHDWNVDFAAWCSYKYLCGSPGGVGGIFVHERHHPNEGSYAPIPLKLGEIGKGPRLTGWWGHRESTRFEMSNRMELAKGAASFRRSCPSKLLNSMFCSSLRIFKEAGGMSVIREKSIKLTSLMEHLLTIGPYALSPDILTIITPKDVECRGAQLSLCVQMNVDNLYRRLLAKGVICDVRRPNCIRIAPAPLYNTFHDVLRTARLIYEEVCSF